MPVPRIPVATYRIQFNREFTMSDAGELVPYLHALGVTEIYASPLLQSRQGSSHGYDVTDPTRLNGELGGEDAFTGLVETLRKHGMGLLLDIVPNHMAASTENPWWTDLLQNGPGSRYAPYFDINWLPARAGLAGKVLLPVLGSPYGETLENGELLLELAAGGFRIRYREQHFPLAPGTYRQVLLKPGEEPGVAPQQLQDLAQELDRLPPCDDAGFPAAFEGIIRRLWRLYQTVPEIKLYIDQNLQAINGVKKNPAGFNHLDDLLAAQHYRLAFWRLANREINYRRFFGVSDLVSIRIEDERVFNATHRLVLRLAREGQVTGLRIDHIDGLHDPEGYLKRLQKSLAGTAGSPGFYVVVEKILGPGEELPATWPVHGTTGYDFLNLVNGLFVHEEGLAQLQDTYTRFGGPRESFKEVAYRLKMRAMAELFGGEMKSLAAMLEHLAEQDRHGRDLSLDRLEEAVITVIACLPVYRTYTRDFTITGRNRAYIEAAVASAALRNPHNKRALAFLRRVLLLELSDHRAGELRQEWLRFVMRWQQFTGPVMAKGVEDAAMYVYNRLVSLNEVGSDPHAPAISLAKFHTSNRYRLEKLPHSMNATSTHDTKRSEDVRMRINVLSEIPGLWAEHLKRWRSLNERHKVIWHDRRVPGGNMEQFIYQTLVGAWPLREEEVPGFKKRLEGYLVKAAREAGTHTGWLRPNEDYEKALVQFANSILEAEKNKIFLEDFKRFQAIIARYGAINSLAQVLLKITTPGVPDFYQGTELWDFSLVDPDNRRPVDYDARVNALAQLREREKTAGPLDMVKELLENWRDGRVKLFTIYRALRFRRANPGLFSSGEYIPLEVAGPGAGHVCAFARRAGNNWAIVAVPRLLAFMRYTRFGAKGGNGKEEEMFPQNSILGDEKWENTVLLLPDDAPRLWRNIFTRETLDTGAGPGAGRDLPPARVWNNFPVALFTQVPENC